jgi:cephalosporin-C deacetylase
MITCPMLVSIGLNDDVCPPETGYDLKKALVNAPVEFNPHPRCAHDAGSFWHAKRVEQFLAEHLKPGVANR